MARFRRGQPGEVVLINGDTQTKAVQFQEKFAGVLGGVCRNMSSVGAFVQLRVFFETSIAINRPSLCAKDREKIETQRDKSFTVIRFFITLEWCS